MKTIVLVAETGSDLPLPLAEKFEIQIVPMHVSFDGTSVDDGSFPPEKILDFYKQTGKLPTTSGSTPGDFERIFDQIHEKWPEAQILYLAYSAVTTCSYQSGIIAAEGRDYVTAIDTMQVSVGQAAVVVAVAELLTSQPELTIAQAAEAAKELISRAKMCFLPDNLEFLRAGGVITTHGGPAAFGLAGFTQ